MAEVASAYVSLLPSAQGFGKGTSRAIDPEMDKAGKSGGAKLVAGIGAVVTAAAVTGAVKGLYAIGSTFDDVSDTIRVGTGATGAALEGLNDSAKSVGKSIPVAFSEIGPTIADINTRLGLTGKPLEKLTKQFLEAGRITGEALDVNAFSSAFSAFDVQGGKTTKVMDTLYRVSQATGVGMNTLASSVARNAPNLKQFGFSIGDSAALIGTLDKAGLDSNKTLATLSRAMVTFAKDGKEPQKALLGTVEQIRNFTKAGDDAKAINLASEIFGTRGASQFVAAIKSGKVNLEQLMGSTGATSDTILKAGQDTADFAEQWQLFKNNALLTLEPVATRVFGLLGTGGAKLNALVTQMQTGVGVGGQLAAAFTSIASGVSSTVGFLNQHRTAVTSLVVVMGTLVAVTQVHAAVMAVSAAGGMLKYLSGIKLVTGAMKVYTAVQWALNAAVTANPIGLIIVGLVALGVALVIAYKKSTTFRNIVNAAFAGVKAAASAVVKFFTSSVPAAFNRVKSAASSALGWVKSNWPKVLGILVAPFAAGAAAISGSWARIKAGGSSVMAFIRGIPGQIKGAFSAAGSLLVSAGRAIVDGLWAGISSAWSGAVSRLAGLAAGLPKVVKKVLGIASPSKVMARLGVEIPNGLAKGINKGAPKALKAVKSIADNMINAVKAKIDAFKSLRDSIKSTFAPDLFSASPGDFLMGLRSQLSNNNAVIGALKKLRGMKLNPQFLTGLISSGNTGLITALAGASKGTVQGAQKDWLAVQSTANQIGTTTAANQIGQGLSSLESELKKLNKAVKVLARETGKEVAKGVNKGASNGKRNRR